jgi:alpha-ketoglutarate-dependent taurine dioxygenase
MQAPPRGRRQLGQRLEGPEYDIRRLDAAMFAKIESALLASGVVCLPGQILNPNQLHTFGSRFGPPVPPAWGGRPVEFALSKEFVGLLPLTNRVDAATGEPLGAHKFGFGWHTDCECEQLSSLHG